MSQKTGLDCQPGVFPLSDLFAEMDGIPVEYDSGEQVAPGHSLVLALARAVADFALAPDPECVLERVMGLALVQAGVGPALHIGVEQPVDHEGRSLDPSDFAESDGQFLLARIGRELSQQLVGRKGATGQGASNPQDVRPVAHDHVLPDFVAGQSDQGFRNASGLEDMPPFRRQVPDAREEPIAEQGCDGEDMVGETAGVGLLLADAPRRAAQPGSSATRREYRALRWPWPAWSALRRVRTGPRHRPALQGSDLRAAGNRRPAPCGSGIPVPGGGLRHGHGHRQAPACDGARLQRVVAELDQGAFGRGPG